MSWLTLTLDIWRKSIAQTDFLIVSAFGLDSSRAADSTQHVECGHTSDTSQCVQLTTHNSGY